MPAELLLGVGSKQIKSIYIVSPDSRNPMRGGSEIATVPIEKVGQLKFDNVAKTRPQQGHTRRWVGDEESFNLLLSENHPAHLSSFPLLLPPVFNFANDVVDV